MKTCTGFVPFILARNQFLLFSQVLSMFEAGCCQSLQFLSRQQIQWLHFRFHPSIPLESLPAFSPRGPSQNPTLNPCDLRDEYQAPPMFPLWVLALSTLAFPFPGVWLPRHTHSRLRCCFSSVSHCLPGIYWMSTGLLTLRGSKPEYPNPLPQQLSPQGFLFTWSSKLGTWGRSAPFRRQVLRLLQRTSVIYTTLFLVPHTGHSSLSSLEMSSVLWAPCL